MRLADLNAVNRTQINRAGAQYTPGIDPAAPNIEIRELALALAVIGDQNESRIRLREWRARCAKVFGGSQRYLYRHFEGGGSHQSVSPTRSATLPLLSRRTAGITQRNYSALFDACRPL